MIWFGGLLFSLMMLVVILLGGQWFRQEWDKASALKKISYLVLPWLPLILLRIYCLLYRIEEYQYKAYFGIFASLALLLTGINIYRSLWSKLVNLQFGRPRSGGGRLLLNISAAVVFTITAIISLFSVAYAMVSYLSGPSGGNYIMEGNFGYRLVYQDLGAFFYFSSVTYFSLGYGDYLPRGVLMILLVYLESLLGYINSGILIAYAFNLFTKLNR